MSSDQESQPQSAQRTYDARAPTYEASWHPAYSARLVAELDLRPGQRVLSLCCGTGLDAFLAAAAVGAAGAVVAVDVSDGMLAEARRRQREDGVLGPRIRFLAGDAADLDGVAGLERAPAFDWIVCSNAFVLLRDPPAVLRGWIPRLARPSGRLAVDVPHERNLPAGLALERAALRLGVAFPSRRAWIRSRGSFAQVLAAAGLAVEKSATLDKVAGRPCSYYGVADADGQFDYVTGPALTVHVASDDFKEKVKPLFLEEWSAMAVDGKIEVVDALYLYVARLP